MGKRHLVYATALVACGALSAPAFSQQPPQPAAPAQPAVGAQPAPPTAQPTAQPAQPAAQPAAHPAQPAQKAAPTAAPAPAGGQAAKPAPAAAPAAGGGQPAGNAQATGGLDDSGRYRDAEGNPTFKVGQDGMVDWATYSGYRRYHSECHVCHGPEAMGSSFAPALKDSLKNMTYAQFTETVSSGRQNMSGGQEKVMPAFGSNPNVMCYIDDLYTYLKARASDQLKPGRPAKHEEKPDAWDAAEKGCMPSAEKNG